MKKTVIAAIITMLLCAGYTLFPEWKTGGTETEWTGRSYDRQILELYNSIQKVIADNKLMENKGIKTLPYQTEINFGPDKNNPQYVELIKHIYVRDGLFQLKAYRSWREDPQDIHGRKTISKLETIIQTKNFKTQKLKVLL